MESNTKPRLRTRPTSRVSLAIVATIAVLIGLVAPQSIALANGFFSGEDPAGANPRTGVFFANNRQHAVRPMWLSANYRNDAQWSFTNIWGPWTVMNLYFTETDNLPDVNLWDDNYGDNGIIAWNSCTGSMVTIKSPAHPDTVCRGGSVRMNLTYGWAHDTANERRSIVCHEFGHTVGLHHSTEAASCLRSGGWQWGLTDHDRAHINGRY